MHEREQAGEGIEVVLHAARRQYGRDGADRQLGLRSGPIGAQDEVATAAPRRRKLEIGAMTTVKRAPVHERSEAQRAARVHEILELITRPPVTAGLDQDAAEDLEGSAGRVHEALEVDFEVITILPVASEHPPFEPRRLPVRAPQE